jgi:alkylation response protein AidB-like acyl-CoA dehydrogenase
MINSLELTAIPPEDEALRADVRAFLRSQLAHMTTPQRARSWMGFDADFSRAMGQRGWLGLTLPSAYGGHDRNAFTRYVVVEELLNAGAPVSAHWIADRQSGPLILKYGTEVQKRFYLPRICAGEAFFCIGMSEPNSGSDLASVTTRATSNEQGWLLNGRKVWTTNAFRSHYMIALVRTSGEAGDRHAGLSQVIVDLSLPGVTVRPITDITGDNHFSEVFFDNVQLGSEALIGAEGSGWEQVVAELAFERSGPERIYASIVLMNAWVEHLRTQGANSTETQRLVGRLCSHLTVLRAMVIAVTAKLAAGESPVVEAALVKDLGTQFEQDLPLLIADALAQDPSQPIPPVLHQTLAFVTQISPSFSLRGGTREILRGMIARGLGLR